MRSGFGLVVYGKVGIDTQGFVLQPDVELRFPLQLAGNIEGSLDNAVSISQGANQGAFFTFGALLTDQHLEGNVNRHVACLDGDP